MWRLTRNPNGRWPCRYHTRQDDTGYVRPPMEDQNFVPEEY